MSEVSANAMALVQQNPDLWSEFAKIVNINPSAVAELLNVPADVVQNWYSSITRVHHQIKSATRENDQRKVINTGDKMETVEVLSFEEFEQIRQAMSSSLNEELDPNTLPNQPTAIPSPSIPATPAQPTVPELEMQNKRLETLANMYLPKIMIAVRNQQDAHQLLAKIQMQLKDLNFATDSFGNRLDRMRGADVSKLAAR